VSVRLVGLELSLIETRLPIRLFVMMRMRSTTMIQVAEKKIYKVSYYDEIEAQTEAKALEILKRQITSDVEYGDFSVWEIKESDNE
jgi:hypothetical protein